jgi:RNase adaptor protein for sRNA GlmZ degradation
MARTAKIAVSVDAALLRKVEQIREQTGESRSAAVSRALRLLTREDEHARLVREYVRAYRDHPETTDEIAAARVSAKRALASVAWDEE